MSKYSSRKKAPNDILFLFATAHLLVANWYLNDDAPVLSSMLLGTVPVLGCVVLRQLPWMFVNGRWNWRSFCLFLCAIAFSVFVIWSQGYQTWWLGIVLFVFFLLSLIGMQVHRWTSILMGVCCALMGWLLL